MSESINLPTPHTQNVNNPVNSVNENAVVDVSDFETPTLVIKTKPLSEYQQRLNKNANPIRGLYILTSFRDKTVEMPVKMLIDSGSTMSLMDRSLYDRMPNEMKPPITEPGRPVRLADGSIQQGEGFIKIPMKCEHQHIKMFFYVGKIQ